LAAETVSPGEHALPLKCAMVPGGPDVGERSNDVIAAPAAPVDHDPMAIRAAA
jgi:hypothetical protein